MNCDFKFTFFNQNPSNLKYFKSNHDVMKSKDASIVTTDSEELSNSMSLGIGGKIDE